MAYNEEANIGHLLESVRQQTAGERIKRIIVVASGCTDRTCEIVGRYADDDARITLLIEPSRGGKVLAINAFLAQATEPILLVSSADIIFEPDTVAHLTAPFDDDRIGMVGAHPIPMNSRDHFAGFAVNMMWQMHHEVALEQPKMGELIAFRNVFKGLNPRTMADEVQVEYGIRAVGYEAAYAPNAIVHNRGPETLKEFIAQRTRCNAYNLQINREQRIPVSTMQAGPVLKAMWESVRRQRPRLDWLVAVALVELYCRAKGWLQYPQLCSPRHRLWAPQATTKGLVVPPDSAAHVPVQALPAELSYHGGPR